MVIEVISYMRTNGLDVLTSFAVDAFSLILANDNLKL